MTPEHYIPTFLFWGDCWSSFDVLGIEIDCEDDEQVNIHMRGKADPIQYAYSDNEQATKGRNEAIAAWKQSLDAAAQAGSLKQ